MANKKAATKLPPIPAPPPPPSKPSRTVTSTKKFSIGKWVGEKEGDKVLLYAKSGMGKTTLAAMAPNPVFIGLDDGGRKIKHPKTGENLVHIRNIETFEDVLAVLNQLESFSSFDSIVIDTLTKLEELALDYMFRTITVSGRRVQNIEEYGYGKGYRYLLDTMRLLLAPLDNLVRHNKNIILICQKKLTKVSNAGGEDFVEDAPALSHRENASVMQQFIEWSDYVFLIDYEAIATAGKKASSRCDRVIRTAPEIHFEAKARGSMFHNIDTVTFRDKTDDSIWQFLFGGDE